MLSDGLFLETGARIIVLVCALWRAQFVLAHDDRRSVSPRIID